MMFRIFVWRLFENTKFGKNLLLCFKYKRQRRAHEQTLSKSSLSVRVTTHRVLWGMKRMTLTVSYQLATLTHRWQNG